MSLPTLVALISRLGRLSDAIAIEVCRRHDLNLSELRVLATLRQTDGALAPTQLGPMINQTSGGLTATLRRLERRGLVGRVADPNDGRARLTVITEPGAELLDRAYADLVDRHAVALAGLDLERALVEARQRQNERLGGYQIGSADTWTADQQRLLTEARVDIESRVEKLRGRRVD